MKKWIILGASVLVVVCICAYLLLFVVDAGHGLSFYMEKKIEADWRASHSYDWDWGPIKERPVRAYLGEDNGYLFFFERRAQQAVMVKKFGDIKVKSNTYFELYAYKNGVFQKLEEAYEQGLISDDAILMIKEKIKGL